MLHSLVSSVLKMDDGLVYEDDGLPNKGDGSAHHQWPKNRIFDGKMRNQCWQKADVVPGRHPERWRKDVAGNIVCRRLTRCEGCLCYEYDHVRPFSKGGQTTVDNCQILQSRVNRMKSNRSDLASDDLKQFSCDLKFTDKELDLIEMGVYGNVIRPGLQCKCKSVAETLGTALSKQKGPEMSSCKLPHSSAS
ncbi:uncharacterized protein [Physcomitrium patens]|uniref:uncharacterized protein isoform X1 n=2 Tax=Physcomitrium patens TaxID=3218 RepID=UPI000D152D10|nr:uncharacterized protein LOC112295474 isoform X1 [Physcomitrium patens]|eukprot:XP_024402901.1 uncharacterized protein LOC112295474 isoform X1 [Physcomitrella patens]